MELKKLLNLIEIEKQKIKDLLSTENKELEFFDDVITKNSFNNIKNLLNIDYSKLMTAYLCTLSNKLTHEEIYDLVNDCITLTKPENEELLKKIGALLEIESEPNKKLTDQITIKILKKELENENQYNSFEAFQKLVQTYEYSEDFAKIFAIIRCLIEIKEDYFINKQDIEDFKNTGLVGIRMSSKDKRNMNEEMLKDKYKINEVIKELSIIDTYYDNLRTKDKNTKRTLRKSLANYTKLSTLLQGLTEQKILNKTTIEEILNLIDNEEILKEFMLQITIEHNKIFKSLNTEYQTLSQDNKIAIQSVLNKYKIDFNTLPTNLKNKLLATNIDELEYFLTLINQLGIQDYNTTCFILENSNCEVLLDIINRIKDGILDVNFVVNNINILSINEEHKNNYNSFLEKINLFVNEKINPHLFLKDLNIYLTDYNQLAYNINVLKQYNLLFGLNKLNSFELLKEDKLENKIDLLLELGYEKLLEENIVLLNNNITKIKKLYLLKSINQLPTDIETLTNTLENNNFLEHIDDIDSYIFNIVNYRIDTSIINEQELNLDKYFSFDDNNRVLDINGLFLSKNRIKRNALKLEKIDLPEQQKLIYSIVYGAILNEEEYKFIISNLSDINKKIKNT